MKQVEIKLRAWDEDNCVMLKPHDLYDISVCRLYATGEGFKYRSKLIPMLFIGKQIEDIDVFVGDIISLHKNDKEYFRGVVSNWDYVGCTIDSQDDYMEFDLTGYKYFHHGNIYENKDQYYSNPSQQKLF